ncbi:MAG: 4-hydroxythreonine-4-phosphate dehydrogenase PdxA [Flavobacteriales bacterium CG03_land_8_20_14_0_80_35_15]|nr:4-hydroxythreonine-4-phosphate dehydrogenase PdxA [Zetaproteobacteria bacterium]OIO11647.1 MAG: 4-hydroxythreonine-4-phosphate dehydrogenase PdxA [Flavobacteriaceae bacterium CG1_02_35_72]PIR14582.1 MAG: 4-hydroxythreonine-4-phosphate dehydrogenase PdxA [Flavobacteriales bacterium CG11_big_fil_rev_8_21_14_0_20_35_7]PIV16700.1 MAG: 4-hydroxythreonine-4-phosphate dehydrogenase PdxA [Flavobacteriales bacterium CG03_land_8_20_14_0_80_35_15]PIX06460.1 MAG: 4-hydroxythreonine-4-phosphate dehydroge
MKKDDKIRLGISIGDLNGIGLEVILKTFDDVRMLDFCTPIIFGSTKTISFHKNALNLQTPIVGISNINSLIHNKINLLNVWQESVDINFGQATTIAGKYAYLSLNAATEALKNNAIDVLVTAPINKQTIQSDVFHFNGHTEYLESVLGGKNLMILMDGNLRMGLATTHIPLSQVAEKITPALIEEKIAILNESLKQDFNIQKPRIAVLALNPHSGDNGVIGNEETEIIIPTLNKIQESGVLAFGPYAADGFFGNKTYLGFDAILAMYHDQGLAPFKALSFGNGVNFTAGLSKIRTSPDHGTAFDIAGKGTADFQSFKSAVYSAIDIFRNRETYCNLNENRLKA